MSFHGESRDYLPCLVGEAPPRFRLSVERGRAELTGRLNSTHLDCRGRVHSGLIACLLDTAMGKAFASLGFFGVTALFEVDYLEEIDESGAISARGEVVREDRSRVMAEGRVRCGQRSVARGRAVFLKTEKGRAAGRAG